MDQDSDYLVVKEWLLSFLRDRHKLWHDFQRICEHLLTTDGPNASATRLKYRYKAVGITDVVWSLLMDLKREAKVKTHNGKFKITSLLEEIAQAANGPSE